MSNQNDGISRYAAIPLDNRGVCYIQGRRATDAGTAPQILPVACIGAFNADVYPTPAATIYGEYGGTGIDFHNGQATVNNLGYDVRLLASGAAATNGGSDLAIGCNSILLGGAGNLPLGMDIVSAAPIVIPTSAPFMGTYTALAGSSFTLPAATAGQRFTLINLTGADLVLLGVAPVNAGGGALPLAGIVNNGQYVISAYQSAVGVYGWRAAVSVPGA